MPKVSINLCCYNSEKYLEETLQSIFRQTYEDSEVVVINDGSTDSTERIIQKHVAEGWPIVYHSQENLGLGKARNKAIELSSGEFIALIDHDDLWHPEKLERQLKLFVGRPQVGLVYSESVGFVSSDLSNIVPMSTPMYRGQVLTPLVLGNFIVCSSIVIRRNVLDKVGWFNTAFHQVEEYDLSIRIAESYEFDYVRAPLVKYRLHQRNSSWDGVHLQSEMIELMGQLLKRRPQLSVELGLNVTRLKRAGLRCTLGEACLLQGRLQEASECYGERSRLIRVLPRVLALYLLSYLPPYVIANLIGWWYQWRKWMIARSTLGGGRASNNSLKRAW